MTQLSTANHQEKSVMKNAVKLLAASLGLFAAAQANAQTNVVSDPVGFYKVSLTAGSGNFVSGPMHKVHAYRGLVSGVSGNIVTLSGTPNLTASAYGPQTPPGGATSFTQYILILRRDASAAPASGNSGDWWQITANGTNTVTLNPAQGAPATFIGAGDQVEIRKLTSMLDLFGSGSTLVLNKDLTGDQSALTADVIRYITSAGGFGAAVSYYDDGVTPGYLLSSDGSISDGSVITIEPDEPLMVFRKTGTPSTNITALGQVQTVPLTHYFQAGFNAFGNPFPANAPLGPSGLGTSGWNTDPTGDQSALTTDVIRVVNGTSFGAAITLLDASVATSGTNTWFDGAFEDNNIPVLPGRGYVVFRKVSSGGLTWRQTVPFTP